MLRKLLKYEIKATGRTLVPLYIALVVFAIINKAIIGLSNETFDTPLIILLIAYGSLLIGTLITTLIVMVQRFYRNLLSDEGYLMFTLPTVAWKHIISKLMISLLWTYVGSFIGLSTIFILSADNVELTNFFNLIMDIGEFMIYRLDLSSALFIIELLLLLIIMPTAGILIIYASIAIGHLRNKHKLLVAIAAFIGLSTLYQIMAAILYHTPFASKLTDTLHNPTHLHLAMWIGILFHTLMAALYFIITNTILGKRLNLE